VDDLDALAADLERAGLLMTGTDAEGSPTYTLTADGARLGTMLAMGQTEDADAVMEALLGAAEA
jgi:hypothetical protein